MPKFPQNTSPFRMKSSPAKAGDYVATAGDLKKQSFVNRAFRAKNDAINRLMSKHSISKSKATAIWNKNQ